MNIIKAEIRAPGAKGKQLRRAGIVPCVISGAGMEGSVIAQIDSGTANQLRRTRQNGSKADIQIGEKIYQTLIRDLEYDSISDSVVHISFQALDEEKKVNSVADIVLLNKDKAQGVLEQMQTKVPHAARPKYLLDTVSVDLAGLPVGTVLTIGEIPEFQSGEVELQVDPNCIVLRINDKKRSKKEFPAPSAEQ